MKQKLWINNNIEDRTYMLEKTEESHPGVGQAAIEKDWWVSVTLKALFQTDCSQTKSSGLPSLHLLPCTLTSKSVLAALYRKPPLPMLLTPDTPPLLSPSRFSETPL